MAYEIEKLAGEDELFRALKITDLAGSDVPNCTRGVFLVRFKMDRPVTSKDISDMLDASWKEDLPMVITSDSGFDKGVVDSIDYEDVHVFASAS